jgi:hypothetical protein
MEPAVLTMTFATPGTGATRNYIDLSQVASLCNRRFYRQGINWAVAGFKVSSTRTGTVNIFKLPNTWVLSNAWMKSFKAWRKMIALATENSGSQSIEGKFSDFKIFADAQHHQAGMAANLRPLDSAGVAAAAGEWVPSKFQLPNATSNLSTPQDIVAVGANFPGISPATGANAVSMIQGYADSRALPYQEDPNVPADADTNWMVRLFSDGSEQDQEVVAELEVAGDQAPYPYEGDGTNPDTMYPGGETNMPNLEWHDLVTIYESNVSNGISIQRLKGGNFPCGLICIDWQPNESANLVIQIDLIPGAHRGYLCEKMGDM